MGSPCTQRSSFSSPWFCRPARPRPRKAPGQGTLSADPRTRCAELVAFWQRHGGSRSEGFGGGDIARKNAEVDCGAGRYESGIRAMEDLLRRNGYTVPPAGSN